MYYRYFVNNIVYNFTWRYIPTNLTKEQRIKKILTNKPLGRWSLIHNNTALDRANRANYDHCGPCGTNTDNTDNTNNTNKDTTK